MADRSLNVALIIKGDGSGGVAAVKGVQRSLNSAVRTLATFASAAAAAFSARELLRAAESYGTLSARTRIATQSQAEYERAQTAVFAISQRTRSDLKSTGTLYTRLADGLRRIGATQGEQLQFVETLNQALAVSGSTGAEARSVVLQLSQALGAGALRGEEFNSVSEGGQRIMLALADALGQPIDKLREMAAAVKLTSDVFSVDCCIRVAKSQRNLRFCRRPYPVLSSE